MLANSLRLMFPERFDPAGPHAERMEDGGGVGAVPELAISVSSGDYPSLNWNQCMWDGRDDCFDGVGSLSPVLQFGSVFRAPVLPDYLHEFLPDLRMPDFDVDVAGKIDASSRVNSSTRNAAVDAMRGIYDELIPRWRGVVWTAEAERDAERINNALSRKQKRVRGGGVLPWCNIKLAGTMHMERTPTPAAEVEYYRKFAEYGIPAAGEAMDLETLGTYKYHIDLGGGGGTTWSGTLEKLGLPGLLFHHITPTMI
jgi:hypothetical protein